VPRRSCPHPSSIIHHLPFSQGGQGGQGGKLGVRSQVLGVRRKTRDVRRQTADGGRTTEARIHARSSSVVGRRSVAPMPSFRRPAGDRNPTAREDLPPRHKDTNGRLTGRSGRKDFTTETQRTRRNTDEHGAFLAPSALVGAAWAARRKASQLLSLMNILLNSKFKIYNSPRCPPPVPSRLLALRALGRPLFPVIATLGQASRSNPALLALDNGPFWC
jgi:hypothetical protein